MNNIPLQLNPATSISLSIPKIFDQKIIPYKRNTNIVRFCSRRSSSSRGRIRATANITDQDEKQSDTNDEAPSIDFAFIHSVFLPDGTLDVHYRKACGGQKLRDIMMDSNIELYGPYSRPLLNCGGGGTCGTCLVEVVEGKELLGPRTEKESANEALYKKPKTWRLACQTTVGDQNSTGLVVIQQLPEWKAHEWRDDKSSRSQL